MGFTNLSLIFGIILIIATGTVVYIRKNEVKLDQQSIDNIKEATSSAFPSMMITAPSNTPKINRPTSAPSPSKTFSPAPKSDTQSDQFITFVSPKKGASYKYGELIPIELKVQDETKISKIDLAWGKNGSLGVMRTLTNPPFTDSFRVTEYSSYLIEPDGKMTIGVYVYDKSGKYFASDLTEVKMSSSNSSVSFLKPTDGQEMKGTNNLPIEVSVNSDKEIEKVELYAGSGALIKTFTQKPYVFDYDISSITCCFDSKYNLPLSVRAYTKDGNNISQSITVYISK